MTWVKLRCIMRVKKQLFGERFISLTEYIRKNLHKGNTSYGAFVDLQKAFDTFEYDILLAKLEHINDLKHAIKFGKVHHFADDTNLLHFSKSANKLNKYINLDMKNL